MTQLFPIFVDVLQPKFAGSAGTTREAPLVNPGDAGAIAHDPEVRYVGGPPVPARHAVALAIWAAGPYVRGSPIKRASIAAASLGER